MHTVRSLIEFASTSTMSRPLLLDFSLSTRLLRSDFNMRRLIVTLF